MNTPNPNQLWNAGKCLVAAELLRRGAYAKVDLGSRSDPDVTGCSRDRTRTVQIKVKVRGARSEQVPSWQWDVRLARQALDAPHTKYLVLVDLAPSSPEYYICQLRLIARRVLEHHEDFLNRHRGTRPRTPESKHTVIHREAVASGKDAWERLGVLGND